MMRNTPIIERATRTIGTLMGKAVLTSGLVVLITGTVLAVGPQSPQQNDSVQVALDDALFDSYVAVWDAKYEYNHWRPHTAIREAEVDDNPRTEPDRNWEPLRTTPPFPEYVSAHATACSASFGILERLIGHEVPFTMATTTAPPGMPTRTFAGFRAAALECADSRVRLGWHFRYSTEAGLELGERIARFVVRRSLRNLSATWK